MALKIYTRGGDRGTTAVHGGERVLKTDARIEANGTLDELNAAIGVARSFIPHDSGSQPILKDVQTTLMTVMSRVATPSCRLETNPNPLPGRLVEDAEETIDRITALCGKPQHFILPGGNHASAFLHQARTVCRRAERRLWALDNEDSVEREILRWVNRLSDLLFVLARFELLRANLSEEEWKLFTYKRK